MFRLVIAFLITAAWPLGLAAEEIKFDFTQTKAGKLPEKFSTVFLGKDDPSGPAKWEITETQTPSSLAKEDSKNTNLANGWALSQTSSSSFRKGASICLFEDEEFHDFTFSTRIRIDNGAFKQMAGIVFRAKDAKNFYALALDSIEGKIRLIKVVDSKEVTSWKTAGELAFSKNEWHTLRVVCKSNQFSCYHNGVRINNDAPFSDSEQLKGKVGFITFLDTTAGFAHPKVSYKRRIILAQRLIESMKTKWERIEDVQIFARVNKDEPLKVVGSLDPTKLGQQASDVTEGVVETTQYGYAKENKTVTVTAPVRDRNGEPVAAVKIKMRRFRGQTKKASIVRTVPIVKHIESRMRNAKDLLK